MIDFILFVLNTQEGRAVLMGTSWLLGFWTMAILRPIEKKK